MLRSSQILVLFALSVALWVVATLYIKVYPAVFTESPLGSISFLTTLPMGWLSVLLVRFVGRLSPPQLLSGVGLVGAGAMMIDGLILHWAPELYGTNDTVIRFGAAWLLWGYGVSIGIALLMAERAGYPSPDRK